MRGVWEAAGKYKTDIKSQVIKKELTCTVQQTQT